jgi:hypothetical protein
VALAIGDLLGQRITVSARSARQTVALLPQEHHNLSGPRWQSSMERSGLADGFSPDTNGHGNRVEG